MAKCLYPLCGTVRVSAVKRFAVAQLTDFRFLAADKAMLGNFRRGNRVIVTKLDGDTRGGAALSIKAVTGCPILYVGMVSALMEVVSLRY